VPVRTEEHRPHAGYRVGCDCDALAPDVFDADRAALANLPSALPKRTPRFIARLIPSLATSRDRGTPL